MNIELLSHDDLKLYQEFVKCNVSEDHIFANDNPVFDWQHKGISHYNHLIARQNGKLVGAMGVIPQRHFDNCLPMNQICLGLLRVAESSNPGTLLRIYDSVLNYYQPEFIGTTGFNSRMIDFHKWKGFDVGVMNHSFALSPFFDSYKIASVPENYEVRRGNLDKSITWKKTTEIELKSLECNQIFLHQWPLKSFTFLINRYLNHPVYKYVIYLVYKTQKLKSIIVLRKISKFDRTVLRIVDFIGSNKCIGSIYVVIKELLKSYKAEYADLYSTGIPSHLLEKAGLINRHKEKNLIIPNYFEPFRRENVDLNYGYIFKGSNLPIRLFKGDGDQDRPNKISV